MRWTGVTLPVLVLGACASDPKLAQQEVRAQVERTMGAFAAMDLEGFKDGWKWTHWHSSLATAPAPPGSPPGR